MKNIIPFLIILLVFVACNEKDKQKDSLISFVNPFIGTDGHGHTYPGATMPFGMVQLSPDTRLEGWDGCSGYHYSDTIIYGFSHTHLSGTGVPDYCDILLMPFISNSNNINVCNSYYPSIFSHENESASPGYYSVLLDESNIKVELTSTLRAGFHKYTFPKSDNSNIIIDLKHRDKVLESNFNIVNENEIEGMRRSSSWANDQVIYFVAKFSKPFINSNIYLNDSIIKNRNSISGENIKAIFRFETTENEEIFVKVGISAVSIEGARKNLDEEIVDWDFEKIKETAEKEWEKELSKIEINGKNKDEKITFYTALYHTMLAPNLFLDVDGHYRGRDKQIHKTDDFDNYTVFSLWDTYRATHPLYTIIDQKRTSDFIKTFIKQYEQDSLLPVWELAANETFCMIGYHSVPVIVDAYLKGIRDYNINKAYEAIIISANKNHFGLKTYKTYNYIPASEESESVSKTLEYAYDDWCISKLAKELGKEEDYKIYNERAQFYKNIFDASTGFMRAKLNETWFSPFDPKEVNFNYTEANSWQYSFYVPQDIGGLIKLHGGKEKLASKIDEMFNSKNETTGREQADISGLIGQYAQGNEPSHHMAYLYNYLNKPWKTQERIDQIRKEMYNPNPDGLCGNEDCGQMSAWYVFSSLGFYPVLPGSDYYVIGTPLFDKTVINLENGKEFKIIANNKTDKNIYIQSAKLNGENYTKSFIKHSDLTNGGEIIFEMGGKPNEKWGNLDEDLPFSEIIDGKILPIPFVDAESKTFIDKITIDLKTITDNTKIYYTIDNSEPDQNSFLYKEPITLEKSTIIKAKAYKDDFEPSKTITSIFSKIPSGKKLILNTKYANQYSAGGDFALIDFIRGANNFRTGAWQGYEEVGIDAVIDFGEQKEIKKLSIGFIQDIGSWIFYPSLVEFFVSNDGNSFIKVGEIENEIKNSSMVTTKDFSVNVYPKKVRFVKILAENIGVCPSWHIGSGNKSWIFADEIIVE